MSDSNRSTNARFNDIQDDDPFAELTRIMGHDPRAERAKGEGAHGDHPGDDDLEIDLEGELMGDLSSFDAEEAAPQDEAAAFGDALAEGQEQAAADNAANENMDEALSDLDLEMDFDAAFADTENTEAAASSSQDDRFPAQAPEEGDDAPGPEANAETAEFEPAEEDGPAFLRVGPHQAERDDVRWETEPDEAEFADNLDADLQRDSIDEDFASAKDQVPGTAQADDLGAESGKLEEPAATGEEQHHEPLPVGTEVSAADEAVRADVFFEPLVSEPLADAGAPASEPVEDQADGEVAEEHFAPLYAERQPEMEPEDRADADVTEFQEEPAEAFDYSRAAADRHDFLAETLEEENPATQDEAEPQMAEPQMAEAQMAEVMDAAPDEAALSPETSGFETDEGADGAAGPIAETGGDMAPSLQEALARLDKDAWDDTGAEPSSAAQAGESGAEAPGAEAQEETSDQQPADEPGYAEPLYEREPVSDPQPERPEDETSRRGDPLGVFAGDAARPMSTPSTVTPAATMAALQASYSRADEVDYGTQEAAVEHAQAASFAQPEIETVDIADKPAALDDDLDIPDVKTEDDTPPVLEFDDFEAELAGAFGSLATQPGTDDDEEEVSAQEAEEPPPASAAHSLEDGAETGTAAATGAFVQDMSEAPRYDRDETNGAGPGESGIDAEYAGAVGQESPDLYYDPGVAEDIAAEDMAYMNESAGGGSRRRGVLVASLVAVVAVIGGMGAFALSSGNDGSSSPAVVRAGDDPVRVKPENPGGAKVPNQDSEVYQRVAGKEAQDPAQEKLVSSTEEPMDVTGPEPRVVTPQPVTGDGAEGSTSAKSEERLAPGVGDGDSEIGDQVATVQARRVKTVVVKPDGTIASAAAEPASTGAQATTGASASTASSAAMSSSTSLPGVDDGATAAASNEAIAATSMDLPASDAGTGGVSSATEDESTDAVPAEEAETASAPAPTPVPSARPAEETQPQSEPQVASTGSESQQASAPAPGAPTSEWSVQISSQPSVKAAQQSYQDMARRYGDVLSGQGVNIVRADIDGKGTYYRVRIPSNSKDDAIALCSKLKSAGGSCFVSK